MIAGHTGVDTHHHHADMHVCAQRCAVGRLTQPVYVGVRAYRRDRESLDKCSHTLLSMSQSDTSEASGGSSLLAALDRSSVRVYCVSYEKNLWPSDHCGGPGPWTQEDES